MLGAPSNEFCPEAGRLPCWPPWSGAGGAAPLSPSPGGGVCPAAGFFSGNGMDKSPIIGTNASSSNEAAIACQPDRAGITGAEVAAKCRTGFVYRRPKPSTKRGGIPTLTLAFNPALFDSSSLNRTSKKRASFPLSFLPRKGAITSPQRFSASSQPACLLA